MPEFYCPNPECENMAFEPGLCSGCGSELEEGEQYIPKGFYVVEDLDGERLVKKPPQSPVSARIDELLAEMPQGRNCPKCGGTMAHYRLHGYRCMRGCQ